MSHTNLAKSISSVFIPNVLRFSKYRSESLGCQFKVFQKLYCPGRLWRRRRRLVRPLARRVNLQYTFAIILFVSTIMLPRMTTAGSSTEKTKVDTPVAGAINNPPFQVKLNIENGHISHVFIGCQTDATDGFDSRIDDMAPPPGMGGSGYTFLVSPDRKFNLYKDIRGFADTVQWVFYAKPGSAPVTLSWAPDSIPDEWKLFCSPWDGKSESVQETIDCRLNTNISTVKNGFFRFWIVRNKD